MLYVYSTSTFFRLNININHPSLNIIETKDYDKHDIKMRNTLLSHKYSSFVTHLVLSLAGVRGMFDTKFAMAGLSFHNLDT